MSLLSDQQLRKELLSFGETVPPITQRNRQQLQAKLDLLKAKKRSAPVARPRAPQSLIELSDSDGEGSWPSPVREPPSIAAEVEQSIARHRREIQQMIESTRERSLAMNASIASTRSPPREKPMTPKKTFQRPSLPTKSEPSLKEKFNVFWTKYKSPICETLKALMIGTIFGAFLILLKSKGADLIPKRKGINCSLENPSECDELIPVINAIRKQLEIRVGEVDCDLRKESERYMTKKEILKFIDGKGFRFELGENDRWRLLFDFIREKPIDDIQIFTEKNDLAQTFQEALKFSTNQAQRPFSCRLQQSLVSVIQTTIWLTFGTGIFLLIIFLIKRRSKQRENQEKLYKKLVEEILDAVRIQHEEHLENPQNDPWIAVSHVRDTLIPPADRQKMKPLWERAAKQINERESRVRAETQVIHGEEFDVWRWIQPRSTASPSPNRKKKESPTLFQEQSPVSLPPSDGLTPCLKLRNFFVQDNVIDNDEIDLVINSVQNRCASVRHLEHIGINDSFVYLKFSSNDAAARGFHLLNNWKFHGRDIVAKYLRLERYHEHFPEARDSGSC